MSATKSSSNGQHKSTSNGKTASFKSKTAEAVTVSQEAIARWTRDPVPASDSAWIKRASEVGEILEIDTVEREEANAKPEREVELLKASGLVTYLGPKEFGGAGGNWETAYKLIREISKADGSIGQLLGYHLVWFWHARVLFPDAQYFAFIEDEVVNRSFFGGAVNPRYDAQIHTWPISTNTLLATLT